MSEHLSAQPARNKADAAFAIHAGGTKMGHPKVHTKPAPVIAPIPPHSLPLRDLLASIDLPKSTYRLEESRGRGCRSFLIGRRKYVLLQDWQEWLEGLAAGPAANDSGEDES